MDFCSTASNQEQAKYNLGLLSYLQVRTFKAPPSDRMPSELPSVQQSFDTGPAHAPVVRMDESYGVDRFRVAWL